MNIARFGHFAGGVADGMREQQALDMQRRRLGLADMDQRWQEEQRARQRQEWERNDADREIWNATNAEAQKLVDEDRAAYDQSPGRLSLSGEKAPYTPSRPTILRALDAKKEGLLRRGRLDLALKLDNDLEPMRNSLKGDAAKGVLAAMASGNDITEALSRFDDLHHDGYKLAGKAKTITRPDGTIAYEIRRKNKFTGEEQPPEVRTQQQLVHAMSISISKPDEIGKFNFDSLRKSMEADQGIRRDAAAEAGRRQTEGVRQGNREKLAQLEADLALRNKREPGAAGTSAARDSVVSLLREERQLVTSEVNSLMDQLNDTRQPKERAAILARLSAAQQRQREVGEKISAYGSEKRGIGGSPSTGRAQAMPSSKAQLRAGQRYQTSRGPAVWNGTAFELEDR